MIFRKNDSRLFSSCMCIGGVRALFFTLLAGAEFYGGWWVGGKLLIDEILTFHSFRCAMMMMIMNVGAPHFFCCCCCTMIHVL